MKTKIYLLVLTLIFVSWSSGLFSQVVKVEKVITPFKFDISKKLTDVKPVPPGYRDRTWKDKVIPNKEGFLDEFKTESSWKGPDPVLQSKSTKSAAVAGTLGIEIDGQTNLSGVAPPDTDGDVSPSYYMQMVNLSFAIWSKTGTLLYGPADNITLWDGFTGPWSGTNDGDPIILYDQEADRWIASQFALPYYPTGPFYELVAISETNDPRGAWYRYAFQFTNMPDYPKFGIWADGYYLTVNQFSSRTLRFAGAAVGVLERDKMILGDPNARMLFFSLGTSYGSLLPADWDGITAPPSGSPNYLANLGSNSLRIWKASVDWNNTSNSSVTLINTLTTQSFSYSGITINQPGTSQTLDPLQDRLMHRLQYRNFGNYQVMLTNHTVNANGSGQAGVRWYELRNYGSGWSIYQQGTYAPNDGNDRWMGSIAMNGSGDIGLGYSVSSSTTYPSIRFTGQTHAQSGTGIMDVAETSIKEGNKSQTGVNRWGDYSMMSVDPSDDATFWYTNEYSNGGWDWKTQIASFTFGSSTVQPPVADFIGSPTSIFEGQTVNFTDQSTNNPSSWFWSFPGGTPSTSTLQNQTVTYNTTGIYDVTLTATNSAGSDTKTILGYITVSPNTNYCSSSGTNTSKEWIKSVGIGSTSYTSNNNNGYGNFTGVIFNLVTGTNSLTLVPGYSGVTRAEYWKVWIDFNGDKDFNDPGEEVFTANKKKGTVTGTFAVTTLPATPTRMRVSMKYGAAPSSCEQFTYGEVEDYTVALSSAKQTPIASSSGNSDNKAATRTETGQIELQVYPNPASELLNVIVTGAAAKINVKIYNALGQIIDDFDINNDQTTIDLGKLQKGIYYLGVDDGIQNALKKFIRE